MCPRPYTYVAAQDMWGCFDTCTHINSEYINTSLSRAEFPKELKMAFLIPLIKKAEIVKNYRPVSNLSFLSKLIERIVCV